MKRFIDGLMGVVFILIALISNADSHDMTITEELLQRQEDATRELQENQRSRSEELQEIQEERASALREYQDEATQNLNQVDVRKHRKRERRQEKIFDHKPVFKDDLDKYNRKRKKDF